METWEKINENSNMKHLIINKKNLRKAKCFFFYRVYLKGYYFCTDKPNQYKNPLCLVVEGQKTIKAYI